MEDLIQLGGGVALGIAAIRFAERGLLFIQDSYKKANGKPVDPHENKTHDEAVLHELRTMNSHMKKHSNSIERIHETTTWLKNREQWNSQRD